MATGTSKAHVTSFLQERRRAMGGCRFKPENFYEISRVLGSNYAPDLNRVMSKNRAGAASAYLRRLQRDVERSQGGYYDQVQAMPLQIKHLNVRKEDPRSFKSLLVPKLKLSPLPDATLSPRSLKSSTMQSPKMAAEESPREGGGRGVSHHPQAVQSSGYVPHKYFSLHSHTHIHVLFKQMPGQGSRKKSVGASSIVSTDTTTTGSNINSSSSSSSITDSKTSFRSKQTSLKNSKLPTPREEDPNCREEDGEDSAEPAWPTGHSPSFFALPKFSIISSAPHLKKRLAAAADKSPRGVGEKSPRNANTKTNFRSPRLDQSNVSRKAEETSPVNQFSGKDSSIKEALPVKVAAALAAGSSLSALYRTKLPQEMVSAYNKNLPTNERQMMMMGGGGSKSSRLPLPSIPKNIDISGEMLAITSVQHFNAMQVVS